MAILWQKKVNGTHYKVVAAGASHRLYTNDVFHSEYNSKYLFNGGIWDLLVGPALLLRQQRFLRVLVLGVGGGAVVNVLAKVFKPMLTVGLELDATHIMVAKKYFQLQSRNTLLLNVDAITWLENYRGPAFDIVIDDLFGEVDGEPARAVDVDEVWLKRLRRVVSNGGVLVVNFDDATHFRESAFVSPVHLDGCSGSQFTLSLPDYENVIAVDYGANALACEENEFPVAFNSVLRAQSSKVNSVDVRHLSEWR